MMATTYKKHFIPLESNPDVFNDLIRHLGVPPSLYFEDVLSLDDPLPHSTLALILVFPTTEGYEQRKAHQDNKADESQSAGVDDNVVWFKQTINNACGLYGILHALTNSPARDLFVPESLIDRIFKACSSLPPVDRCAYLEDSIELEKAYEAVATQGTSAVPEDAEEEVDYHYACFIKSNGRLYELDGDRVGPIRRGEAIGAGGDYLGREGLEAIQEYIDHEQGDLHFSLMALVHLGM